MAMTTTMKEALDQRFNWRLENAPELERPVLIVLDYSPSDDQPSLSIAFDFSGGPKCWMTESRVRKIGGQGPKLYAKYRKFVFGGREFHPYSIRAFPQAIFEELPEFASACQCLYQHVDWSE